MLGLRGNCLSRVDFPSWFVVRNDIQDCKINFVHSKISPPKPHVRPLLIGIYCIDLLASHLNTSIIYNIHFLQTSTGYLMTFVIVMGLSSNYCGNERRKTAYILNTSRAEKRYDTGYLLNIFKRFNFFKAATKIS